VRRVVACASVAVLLAAAAPSVCHAEARDAALAVISDPGSRPPFVASDYEKYRSGSGSSILVTKLKLVDPDPQHPETCYGHSALLYPNTAYTRWMIATWLRMLDGRAESLYTTYPGDRDTGIWIPKSLSPMTATEEADLQTGSCDPTNTVTFTNVPAGNYILVVKMQREYVHGTNRPTGNVLVQTPNGEYPVQATTYGVTGHLGDGYVLVSHGAIVVEAGRTYDMKADNVFPAAHFLPDLHS